MRRGAPLLIAALLAVPIFTSAQVSSTSSAQVGNSSSTQSVVISNAPHRPALPKPTALQITQLNEAMSLLKILHERVFSMGLLPRNPAPVAGTDSPVSIQAALDALKTSIYGASFVQMPLTQVQDLLNGTSSPKSITQAIADSKCVAGSSFLQVGSSGLEVTLLQQFLAGIPALYPEGEVTGYFGSLSKKAVEKLQAALGIEQTGTVGSQTRSMLRALTCRSAQ